MTYTNFNDLLHELRTRELRRVPPGAEVFLSAGCSGRWYFDWIRDNYPGIRRHLGIEAYSPEPADLPPEAVWSADQIFRMLSVADNAVDLVFAGQTIEHLWPDQLSGFLVEAHRVLRPDGILVLDSPNQPITRALKWHQPEHTMEFSVDEIRDLVTLAGFHDISVRGIWLCSTAPGRKLLNLIPDLSTIDPDTDQRIVGASDRPRDSFLWWLEARKNAARQPNIERIAAKVGKIYDREYARALHRYFSPAGRTKHRGETAIIQAVTARDLGSMSRGLARELVGVIRAAFTSLRHVLSRYARLSRDAAPLAVGFIRHGPYMPLRAGRYEVGFDLVADDSTRQTARDADAILAILDVCADNGTRILARRELRARDLLTTEAGFPASATVARSNPVRVRKVLAFDVEGVAFGTEFRVFSTGVVPFSVVADVSLVGPLPAN